MVCDLSNLFRKKSELCHQEFMLLHIYQDFNDKYGSSTVTGHRSSLAIILSLVTHVLRVKLLSSCYYHLGRDLGLLWHQLIVAYPTTVMSSIPDDRLFAHSDRVKGKVVVITGPFLLPFLT